MPYLYTDATGYGKIVDGGVGATAGQNFVPQQQVVSVATAEQQIVAAATILLQAHRELGYLTSSPAFVVRAEVEAYRRAIEAAVEALRDRRSSQQTVAPPPPPRMARPW